MRIGLVGCVKSKLGRPAPAGDLYVSPLFQGRRRYVEATCDAWLILSAEHGVLDPKTVIAPYDRTLVGASDEARRAWALRVLDDLRERFPDLGAHEFELHAGRDYWGFGLREGLKAAGARVTYPVAGMPFAEQVAFYERVPLGDAEDGLVADAGRARIAARRLLEAWEGPGIFGVRDMPESMLPAGMERGSVEHACFITLTVAIDYMRDAADLWRAARDTFEDPSTRWTFDPFEIGQRHGELRPALEAHRVVRRQEDDPATWGAVAAGLVQSADGDPRRLAKSVDNDAVELLKLVRRPEHRRRFPRLRGRKIGPLWIRMLADEVQVPLLRLAEVPIPVDVHIARTTFACGALCGRARGTVEELAPSISEVWRAACEGLDAYPLQLDQALWLQSRDGCSTRRGESCPRESECVISDLCVGGIVSLAGGAIEVDTSVELPSNGHREANMSDWSRKEIPERAPLPIDDQATTDTREKVLAGFDALEPRYPDGVPLSEIVRWVCERFPDTNESTVRTHVTSRMCRNAPNHHAVVFEDLVRVARGRYLRRPA